MLKFKSLDKDDGMGINMKKNGYLFIGMVLMMFLAAGCGDYDTGMSEEQEKLVAEYATTILVKHSPIADRALLNESRLETEIAKEEAEAVRLAKVKELEKAYLTGAEDAAQTDNTEKDNTETDAVTERATTQSMAQFLQESAFSIDYSSYVFCSSYPENSEEDFYMAMDATPGKQLCVISFTVSNLTDSDQELDVLQKKCRFSLKINGTDTIQAQATLLTDDLSSYKGTVPAGAKEELVLVFEVPDDLTRADTMELTMTDAQGNNTVMLE